MDKNTDSKNTVMHVLITDTKGHAASKADAASQLVSEHFTARNRGKKAVRKHYSARTTPDVTQHPFVFPQKGFASLPEPGCSWGKEEHRGKSYSPASSPAVYLEVESFEMLFLTAGRRYALQNCQKTRLESLARKQARKTKVKPKAI